MKELNVEQMEWISGGDTLGCVASVVGGVLLLAGLFATPTGAFALGLWLADAAIGAPAAGIGIGTSCSG